MIKSKPGCASLWSPSTGMIVWVCVAVCRCASSCVAMRHCGWEIFQCNEAVEVWEMRTSLVEVSESVGDEEKSRT